MRPQTKEEIDQLLAIAEGPEPEPAVVPTKRGPDDLLTAFLQDNEIRPGNKTSIEICSFYRFYKAWTDRLEPPPPNLRPMQFARLLKLHGFKRCRRQKRIADGRRERRLLALNREAADKLNAWHDANPDSEADRALFDPCIRWRRERQKGTT